MDDHEKLEFVTKELIAIYEDYESLVKQHALTVKFLKNLIEFAKGTNSPYSVNENGEFTFQNKVRRLTKAKNLIF